MGRRTRRRPEGAPPPVPTEAPPVLRPGPTKRGRARLDELPPAPWHPVPVGEIAVLVGIVLIVIGFLGDDARARTALVAGIVLSSLAGLEQALREHLAGFRSHSTLLAGFIGLACGIGTALVTKAYVAGVVVLLVVFGVALWRLRATFRRRAGVAFRA